MSDLPPPSPRGGPMGRSPGGPFQPGPQGYAPPPAGSGYAPIYQPPVAPPGTNGLAIASLVLSLLWFGGIGALLAIVLGAIAVGQVRRTNQNGHGLATAGIVLGIIGLVVPIFFVLVVFVSRGVVDKDPSIHGGSGGSGGGTNSGQSMACETEQRTVRTAVEAFYAQQGRWPRSNAELVGDYLRAAPRNYAVMPDGSGRVVVKEPSPDDCQ